MVRKYGLIGKTLGYSFSKKYFTQKFENQKLSNCKYNNYEINNIKEYPKLLNKNNFSGLNITIPYKEQIIKYLDELDINAQKIGAVNTIKFIDNKSIGYNTDYIAFKMILEEKLNYTNCKRASALILGNGGVSKSVGFVFNLLSIPYHVVSRTPDTKKNQIDYKTASENISKFKIVVNTTPLGTFPNIKQSPPIDYNQFGKQHFLFDLIYNPKKTKFLEQGEKKGASILNGYEMLLKQAELSWNIWNS